MAKDMKISAAAANAAVDAVRVLLDAGGAGSVEVYGGSVPANVAAGHGTDLLATITLAATAFSAAASGVATAKTGTTAETSASSGTATFFRARQNGGTDVIQGTCGVGTFDMNMNTTSIAAGATVSLTSWTITLPLG